MLQSTTFSGNENLENPPFYPMAIKGLLQPRSGDGCGTVALPLFLPQKLLE
jgi:hypothetical protein